MMELSIGEVAEQAGVAASTIRYYERIGILPEPERVSGRRRYEPEVLQRLALIRFAKKAGFTLAEIETLLHGFEPTASPSRRWRVLAQQKLTEVEELIQQAQEMKRLLGEGLRCGCLTWEDCNIVSERGSVEDTGR
ncbi:MAG: MerR family transcriptional regulator [Chloroflexota bacterium]|nr:MerR family transcriptional regulator [Chloroflexota bacterium]